MVRPLAAGMWEKAWPTARLFAGFGVDATNLEDIADDAIGFVLHGVSG